MSSPDDRFAALVAPLDPAMVVVTTVAGDERSGCLVGFHSQASIDPPRYAVWISKANHTYGVGLHAEHFAVHLLTVDDHDLAELFGSLTGDDVDKFERCDWRSGPGGVPLIDRLPRRIVGRRTSLTDDGSDHVCVVVEPVQVDGDEAQPFAPLRLHAVTDVDPGHEADEGRAS